MLEFIQKLVPWISGLPLTPKIFITAIVLLLFLFLCIVFLYFIWAPPLSQRVQELQYIKTDLRLQFFGDRRIPQEVSSNNIASWFAYFSQSLAIIPKDAHGNTLAGGLEVPPNWAVFVALDKPARFRQAVVTFSNPEVMPVTDVHMANSRVIAISTRGLVPAGVLTINVLE
jgi:hypothetical protein